MGPPRFVMELTRTARGGRATPTGTGALASRWPEAALPNPRRDMPDCTEPFELFGPAPFDKKADAVKSSVELVDRREPPDCRDPNSRRRFAGKSASLSAHDGPALVTDAGEALDILRLEGEPLGVEFGMAGTNTCPAATVTPPGCAMDPVDDCSVCEEPPWSSARLGDEALRPAAVAAVVGAPHVESVRFKPPFPAVAMVAAVAGTG